MNNGTDYIRKMQTKVDQHVVMLEKTCEMDDSDALALADSTCLASRKPELLQERSLCILVRKMVDKPNLHRLERISAHYIAHAWSLCPFSVNCLWKRHTKN